MKVADIQVRDFRTIFIENLGREQLICLYVVQMCEFPFVWDSAAGLKRTFDSRPDSRSHCFQSWHDTFSV